ncbi:hypothetical protein HPB52_019081 [Rhipicephalus sanguineus]|uniref:Uncharacterized protein n=1 Tax=Rhipicephalus sanguineus TaxID=34632 RepID=A0A9D4QBT0_RHISA|nr:hypothetical protein HPB52_019081 [Rhipicephalus sanguineus]
MSSVNKDVIGGQTGSVRRKLKAANKGEDGAKERPVQWQTPDDALPTPIHHLFQVRSAGPPRKDFQDSCV